jgi:hypothetical protein
MIVAAHQPNYLPWLGFFDKLARCDKFLILDHCQFERQGFQNRAKVRMGDGWKWLTVPVVQKSRDERILDKEIANDRDGRLRWGRKQYATLEQVYRGTPHFQRYAPGLHDIFEARWEKLVDLNLALLGFCMAALEIRTPLLRTSRMGPLTGQKSELVLNMCKAAGATVYLSGSGASKEYLDRAAFAAAGVELRFQQFAHPDYPQGHDAKVHGLTVLDLLFNCGPESRAVLLGEAPAPPQPPRVMRTIPVLEAPRPSAEPS